MSSTRASSCSGTRSAAIGSGAIAVARTTRACCCRKRQRADPVAGEREDVEADPVTDTRRTAEIGSECRLTVGSRRHQVKPPARMEKGGTEAGHDVSSLIFEGHPWHRHENVVREKSHQRVEIGGLPRVDELRHDTLLGRRVRSRSRLRTWPITRVFGIRSSTDRGSDTRAI